MELSTLLAILTELLILFRLFWAGLVVYILVTVLVLV